MEKKMKKILAVFVLAAVCLSGVSAKKTIKDHIDQVKIGKFKEVDISDGVFRLKKTFGSSLIATEYTVKLYGKDGSVGIYYKNDLASKESLRFDKDGRDALRKAYLNGDEMVADELLRVENDSIVVYFRRVQFNGERFLVNDFSVDVVMRKSK